METTEKKDLKSQIEAQASALPTERLEAELCQLSAHIAAATCRWLLMVAEYDRRGGWSAWECRSCAHWLSLKTGLGIHAARQHVRVARALGDLPLITATFLRGELSFSKVRALVRIATPHLEPHLVGLARYATASQLDRLARSKPPAPTDEEGGEERRQHRRRVWHRWDDEGDLIVGARLRSDEGAVWLQALEDSTAEVRSLPKGERITAADGMVRMAEKALAASEVDSSGADRNLVILHTTFASLTEDSGASHLDVGPGVLAETARRLACDASLVEVVTDTDGVPLDFGRKTKKIPASLRRALHLRDHQCRFPGCTNKYGLDAHHIRHWAMEGETSLSNLVLLCRHHHRAVHEGPWDVECGEGEMLQFTRHGAVVHDRVPLTPADPREVERINSRAGLKIDSETCGGHLAGERMDWPVAADAIWGNASVHDHPDREPKICATTLPSA